MKINRLCVRRLRIKGKSIKRVINKQLKKKAKCFQGPTGPTGSSGVTGPTGPVGDCQCCEETFRIYRRCPDPNEFVVDPLSGNSPVITNLTGGGYVVAWTTTFESAPVIRYVVYNCNDTQVGNDMVLGIMAPVNNISVASINEGTFIIVWDEAAQPNSKVFAAVYGDYGVPIVPRTEILPDANNAHFNTDVTGSIDTRIIITFITSGAFNGVITQAFNIVGSSFVPILADNLLIADATYTSVRITVTRGNQFALALHSTSTQNLDTLLFDFLITTPTVSVDTGVAFPGAITGIGSIAIIMDIGYVVAYFKGTNVMFSRYDTLGNLQQNASIGTVIDPTEFRLISASGLLCDRFAISWSDSVQESSNVVITINVAIFDNEGNLLENIIAEQVTLTGLSNFETRKGIAGILDGGFILLWSSFGATEFSGINIRKYVRSTVQLVTF